MTGISPEAIYNYLKGMKYPARKDDLIQQAKKNEADRDVIDAMKSLPEKEYKSEDEVILTGSKIIHQK
jgi:hypothetical protein